MQGTAITVSRSGHAAEVLATLGAIADGLEHGAPWEARPDAISASFRHSGQDAAAFVDSLNEQMRTHDDIEVTISRLRELSTMDPLDLVEVEPFGARFLDIRVGTRIRDGRRTPIDPADPTAEDHPLRFLAPEDGRWRIVGNQR